MPIKFFSDFSFEKEVYKLVYTTDNYNNWLLLNPKADSAEFSKQIHNSLQTLDKIPDKELITQTSLDEYLSNFDIYKDDNIRQKVIKLILKKYNPDEPFLFSLKNGVKKEKPFDWTDFKHTEIENGDKWVYKNITVIKPKTWELFKELEENNMPGNIALRRKKNYEDFYGEKNFNRYITIYGITFYFVNYDANVDDENGKTLLFMVIPSKINIDLVPRIRYNSILLSPTSHMDYIYVMGEEKPDNNEVEEFMKKYDLEHILLPTPIKGNLIRRILRF